MITFASLLQHVYRHVSFILRLQQPLSTLLTCPRIVSELDGDGVRLNVKTRNFRYGWLAYDEPIPLVPVRRGNMPLSTIMNIS
jgi:hypothetical protein